MAARKPNLHHTTHHARTVLMANTRTQRSTAASSDSAPVPPPSAPTPAPTACRASAVVPKGGELSAGTLMVYVRRLETAEAAVGVAVVVHQPAAGAGSCNTLKSPQSLDVTALHTMPSPVAPEAAVWGWQWRRGDQRPTRSDFAALSCQLGVTMLFGCHRDAKLHAGSATLQVVLPLPTPACLCIPPPLALVACRANRFRMPLLRGIMRAALRRGKFVKRQGDHGVLSSKRGNKQFYKGNRGHKPGVHTDTGA